MTTPPSLALMVVVVTVLLVVGDGSGALGVTLPRCLPSELTCTFLRRCPDTQPLPVRWRRKATGLEHSSTYSICRSIQRATSLVLAGVSQCRRPHRDVVDDGCSITGHRVCSRRMWRTSQQRQQCNEGSQSPTNRLCFVHPMRRTAPVVVVICAGTNSCSTSLNSSRYKCWSGCVTGVRSGCAVARRCPMRGVRRWRPIPPRRATRSVVDKRDQRPWRQLQHGA